MTLWSGESVTFLREQYNSTGIFSIVVSSISTGCDSIVETLDLTVESLDISIEKNNISLLADRDNSLPVIISGEVASITWRPDVGLSCTDCPNPISNHDTDITYIIEAVSPIGCITTDSIDVNFVVVLEKYFIANTIGGSNFNTDNRNLYLQTIEKARSPVSYSLQVFDRLGNLVFDGTSLEINNSRQGWSSLGFESGVYVYQFVIEEFLETKFEVGTVTVIN